MALRPGTGGAGSFMYPVGGGLVPSQGVPMQPQQPQQGFPMMTMMQPNMQGIVGMNFGAQLPPGAMPMQGGMAMGMPMMGQAQFMGMRAPGPHYTADMQKQMAEDRQKQMEQHQRVLEEERKRRQYEEQKQKLRMLSSLKPKMGEKSRDDALEAIRGNLDGFSRDARMHPSASSHPKNPDSSSSHRSVPPHPPAPTPAPPPPPPPAFPEDDDDFSDFIQGPSAPAPSSSDPPRAAAGRWPGVDGGAGQRPRSAPLPHTLPRSVPLPPASQPSTVTSSSQPAAKGVGVFPQPEHLQPMAPSWLYTDSLIPEMYKQVLEFTMTPAGIDTGKLYPILMSSGLPREALGQIWATANRTTPGKLTKEELYTVLAMIGVTQNGLPASLEVLSQFPSPPVPNLPAVAMVMHQHQQPSMPQSPVPMAMPAAMVPAMGITLPAQAMAPSAPAVAPSAAPSAAPQPPAGFVTSFPPAQSQETKPEDDDFQDFQEAPKAGLAGVSFPDFQAEAGGSFSCLAPSQPQSSAPPMLMPVSGVTSSSSDRYAAFKQLTVDPAPSPPTASDPEDKYSIFRQLEQSTDQKGGGEGAQDFSNAGGGDDGFTSFKTADSVSPLDPPSQAQLFQPAFPPPSPQCPPHSLGPQPHTPSLSQPNAASLSIAELDLFSSLAPPPVPAPSAEAPPPLAAPPGGGVKPQAGGAGSFGDFALFGSTPSSSTVAGATAQDDFADFAAFGSPPGPESEPAAGGGAGGGGRGVASAAGLVGTPPRQRPSDKYDVFKQLSLELSKESGAGSLSSLRSDGDDLADFPPPRLCASLTASDRSLAGRAKEDCASVKSLDLPSIGGSSAGKDDSEDALSVQLDMKLADVGGDLKHVMSDSSLDLPSFSAPPPPAADGVSVASGSLADGDDLKFDPFGTSAASGMGGYDWPDKDEPLANQGAKQQPGPSATPRKEAGGASESSCKAAAFPAIDGAPGTAAFEAFADFVAFKEGVGDGDDEFGDFAVTVAKEPDSPRPSADPAVDGAQGEVPDEFGAFQGDKPKFGKFDFLKASSQAKVRSSEEMIQSELATFDLSVQDSQKRSHSVGEKDLGRSTPSPAPEQPHRDRSNTLSEKPTLPVIRDKYKDLTGEVEESERYAYEWQRCLESALQVISKANNTLNSISSSTVCTEVIQSAQGMEYLLGVVEVYRVSKRVELGIKATAVCSDKLQELLKDVSRVWNNLMGFMSLAKVTPDESSLDFSSCILRPGIKNAKELACGVCLLNVDSRSKAFNSETDNFKLLYGGHQYHASCANFWINCVEPKPPGLILPDLL